MSLAIFCVSTIEKKKWTKYVTALSAFVGFCTVYALIMPAAIQQVGIFCGLEEHTHTLQCYSNPNADIEDETVWAKLFEGMELTEDKAENLAKIAKSQIGYEESTANYLVSEDGETMNGYTRHGAFAGAPLGGAEFELYEKDGDDYLLMSSSTLRDYSDPVSGMITPGINGLELLAGQYKLVETAAPDGYQMLTEEVSIKVNGSGVSAYYQEAPLNVTTSTDGTTTVYTVEIVNHTGYKLPNTGGPGTSLYTLCGCLLMGTALVAGFGRRRRRERRFDR